MVLSQHTLVTEIRELVFPEDRPRYDELVYCCNGGGKLKSRTSYYDLKRVSYFETFLTYQKNSLSYFYLKLNKNVLEIFLHLNNHYWF